MPGMNDGVSKLWILRRHGSLDVDGYHDEPEAIGALVRHAVSFSRPEERAALKARIRVIVDRALRHDEPDEEDGCSDD